MTRAGLHPDPVGFCPGDTDGPAVKIDEMATAALVNASAMLELSSFFLELVLLPACKNIVDEGGSSKLECMPPTNISLQILNHMGV